MYEQNNHIVDINDMIRRQFILTITCYLAMVMVGDKTNDDKQSTLSAGHFDQHGGVPVIAPTAAILTANKTKM